MPRLRDSWASRRSGCRPRRRPSRPGSTSPAEPRSAPSAATELVAKAIDRVYDSYFGGVAGADERDRRGHRGGGVAGSGRRWRRCSRALLRAARDRGAVVSGLFPTAPRIYRRFGYEVVTDLDTIELPTRVLGVGPPAGRGPHPAGGRRRLRRHPGGVRHLGGRAERSAEPARRLLPGHGRGVPGHLHRRDRRAGRGRRGVRVRLLGARSGVRRGRGDRGQRPAGHQRGRLPGAAGAPSAASPASPPGPRSGRRGSTRSDCSCPRRTGGGPDAAVHDQGPGRAGRGRAAPLPARAEPPSCRSG